MSGIRSRRKAERPGEILEAAFLEFIAKGYAATRLEDIAERVGITKGAIYFYFGSKQALFEACIKTTAAASVAAFGTDAQDWTDDIQEDLRSYLGRIYRFMADTHRSREMLRLLVAEASREPELVDHYFRAFMDPVADALRARLERGVADGELRPVSPFTTEVVLSPPLAHHTMTMLFGERRDYAADAFARTHLDIVLHGLLRDSPGFGRWSNWRPVPSRSRAETLVAPLGPGRWEVRFDVTAAASEASRNVAADLAARLTARTGGRPTEYRTLACRSFTEACRAEG